MFANTFSQLRSLRIASNTQVFNCLPVGIIAVALSIAPMTQAASWPNEETTEGQTTPAAGMMRYPDVSKDQIVFSYAGDLWIVQRDGGQARPLASPPGGEQFPRFNQAGDQIAFVGNYEGDRDIYTISVAGGNAQRMTYHPANEILCDWTSDGALIFSSNGLAGLGRQQQLFTISESEPAAQALPVPYGTNGAISDDGKWLAYTPHSRDTRTWKRYRGGMASDVWLFNLEDKRSVRVTDWQGTDTLPMWFGNKLYYLSDNGTQERLNIWEYDISSENHRQVTEFDEFDCKWPSIGPGTDGKGEIILQNGADLYLVNLETGAKTIVEITIPGDRPAIRKRSVDVSEFIQAGDISPNGKRAVVEARGDIWTLPAKNGSPRNLTRTAGVAERMPSWSPDGRWLAYFSDATGEYELYVTQSDGRGETKQLTDDGKAWRYNPVWSPNSKHIVFTDKAGNIFLHSLETKATKLVDTDPFAENLAVSWSHDNRWLTYARRTDAHGATSAVFIYNIESAQATQVTNYFNCSNPVFDRKGDYIYCSSNRAFNRPSYEDVGTTFIYSSTEVMLAIPLRTDVKQPLLPESDEVEWDDEKDDEGKDDEESDDSDDSDSNEEESNDDDSDDPVSGEWAGVVTSGDIDDEMKNFTFVLTLADDGTVTGQVEVAVGLIEIDSGSFDKETGKLELTGSSGDLSVTISATIKDGKLTGKAIADGGALTLDIEATRKSSSGDSADEGDEKDGDKKKDADKPVEIEFDGIEKRIFQLPISQGNFRGLAVNHKNQLIYARTASRGGSGGPSINLFDITDDKKSEKKVVDGAANFGISSNGKKLVVFRGDDFFLIDAAAGQSLSDSYVTNGMKTSIDPKQEWKQVFMDAWRIERDFFYDPNMHGVDWEAVRDHYAEMIDDCTSRSDLGFVIGEMISEINVGHAYYRPGPSDESTPSENVGLLGCRFEMQDNRYKIAEIFEGADWDTDARNPLRAVGITEEDFVLEVNGLDFSTNQNPYSMFVGLGGMTVTLTISKDATLDDDDQRIAVQLLQADTNLRFRAWIENNRRYIDEKSGGKVGYIYVVSTGVPGQNDLFRQFYGQASKEALIVDDRWNGGGQIPTRFIELLNRPVTNYWAKRDGRDWTWPPDSHQGPKCMLINGLAGSGGDMFPALFRQNELGKLIGTRTWGGLVGISGNPQMIDGSSVTAPTFAYYETDGTWGIEGHGVDPDVEVIDDPAKMVDGGDPQLDAAIELMLSEIESNGYKAPKRPAYPDRQKIGIAEDDK